MNFLYAFIYLIITFSITVVCYKFFKKEGLFVWICVSILLSNIQSVKLIDVFGFTTVLGNIAYSNVFLATDILNEFEGKKEANKSVFFGFMSMILFTALMSLALVFIPNQFDVSQESLKNIFTVVPRITLASLSAFCVSQFFDVFIYQKLKKKYNKLWLSNNGSTLISQILDTIIFCVVGYVGSIPFTEVLVMAATMYVLKIIIAFSDTGFIYLTKLWIKKDKNWGNSRMDIVYEGEKPELDMPYFGRQSRYYKFFKSCIKPYLNDTKIYAETNSGSVSNAYAFARDGYKVIVNDVSEYSNAIAKAVLSDEQCSGEYDCKIKWLNEYKNSYIDRAAVFAACIENYGYNASIPEELSDKLKEDIEKYKKHLSEIHDKNVRAYQIYNLDLYAYLDYLIENNIKVDVMFMDFAWPWRDGSKTEEYETTANVFSSVFSDDKKTVEIWDKTNVIENVLKALEKATKVANYVMLSNQSSNFPTPEILEVALLKNGYNYEVRHTMLTDAQEEDNLMKEDFFREYLYVIKGKQD